MVAGHPVKAAAPGRQHARQGARLQPASVQAGHGTANIHWGELLQGLVRKQLQQTMQIGGVVASGGGAQPALLHQMIQKGLQQAVRRRRQTSLLLPSSCHQVAAAAEVETLAGTLPSAAEISSPRRSRNSVPMPL